MGGIAVRRLTAAVVAIGLAATGAVVTVSGAASAAPADNPAKLVVTPPPGTGFNGIGAKKAIVTWGDYPTIDPGFPDIDEYWVVANSRAGFITPGSGNYGPNAAGNRTVGRVPVDGTRKLTAEDLTAGKDYYFAVYALDAADNVIEPSGTVENTPISYILAPGFNLSITTSRSTVLRGNRVELSGTLTSSDGSPLRNRTVTIFQDPHPNSLEKDTTTAKVTTTKGGRWTFLAKPGVNSRYWARFIPAAGIGGWTKALPIDVRAKITLRVQPDTTIRAGRQLTFRGQVKARPALVRGLPICWQSTAGGSWGGGSCGVIRDDGSYVLRLKPGAKADGKYRVRSGLGEYYADSKSRSVKITIR
jgi:hypothetical protein